MKGLSVLSNLIRSSSLSLALFCAAAAVGFAQDKRRQPEKKKKEQPYATGTIIRRPAEYNPASWKEYKSDAGRFSILFPGTPLEESQKMKAGGHELDIRSLKLHEMALYSVMYLDHPPSASQRPDAARTMLDFSVKQAAEMFNAEPLEQKELTLDGHPGRFVMQRLPDGLIMRLKVYAVGGRLYQLMITTPAEQGESDDRRRFYAETASKFLDSFKLLPGTGAAARVVLGPVGPVGPVAEGSVRGTPVSAPKNLPHAPVSGGVLNGKAISKPAPSYPAAAVKERAQGVVTVAIVIDEEGKVMAAEAVGGHELLREAAVAAALKARFSPIRLRDQPVKISGLLTYNFVLR